MPSVPVGLCNRTHRSILPDAQRSVTRRSRTAANAKSDENPFLKFGSQLVQAGSQFTATLTGTTRIAKSNVVKDNVVFVAGATGRVGVRIVRECLLAGYNVRAGVRSPEKGENLIDELKEAGGLSPQQLRRLRTETFDLFDDDTMAPAIGNAATVICAVGAPEDKPFDTSAPKKIDGEGSIRLVEVATRQRVKRFILLSSLGTTKFGLPASVLNLFWGVLYWKKQAENALIKSGMLYTIVRPGGMERPTDTYKETHNTVMYARDKMFGGQISRLQVAEVIAACVTNQELSANKTLEVIALDTVPPRPLEELLQEQPVEITVEELRERQAEIADIRNRADGLAAEAEELEAELAAAEELKLNAERAFSDARSTLQETKTETTAALAEASEAQRTIEQLAAQRDEALQQEAVAKAVLDAQRKAQRDGELLTAADIRSVTDSVLNPPEDPATSAPEKRGAFGGLFGAKPAAAPAEEPQPEAPAQEEPAPKATSPKPSVFGGLFGAPKAPPKAEEEQEAAAEAPEEAPAKEESTRVVKGGGLFGMFQQDTVFADEAEDPVPPSTAVVQRAVTKKGTGRKSVKELIARKPEEEVAEAPVAAPPPAPSKPAPPAKKTGPDAKQLAAKREAAVAAALSNLGSAAKKVEVDAPAPTPASEPPANGASKPVEEPPAPEPPAAKTMSPKEEAKAWIENWRSKQKVVARV